MPIKNINKNQNFNPTLISAQIFLILSCNYVFYILFMFLFNSFFGLRMHIDQIFSPEVFEFTDNSYGYSTLLTNFFSNLFMIFVYVFIVDKANKILDYVITNFFLHILITTFVKHFPFNYFWWVINGSITASVILISEFISLKLDQKEIKLVQFK